MMEFVGDDGVIYSSQIMENVRRLLGSDEAWEEEAQEYRSELLRGIAAGSENSEEVQEALGQTDTLSFIVKHLKRSDGELQTNERVVTEALTAWVRLVRRVILNKSTANPKNCGLSETHFPVLIEVTENFASHEKIVYFCVALIMMLASDSAERQSALGAANAPRAVVNVLKANLRNAFALEMSLRAVRNLAAEDEVANLLVQEGIGEELHIILQDHKEQPAAVIDAAVFAVINLSYDNDIALILGALGICVSLTDLVVNRLEEEDFCDHFCWALRNLSTIAQNLQILKFTRVCEILLQILAKHNSNADTMQSAMWCVANLACHSVLAERLVELSITEAMVSLFYFGVKNYPDDVSLGPICEAITFAIYNLTTTVAPGTTVTTSAADAERPEQPNQSDGPATDEEEENKTVSSSTAASDAQDESLALKIKFGAAGACWLLSEFLQRYVVREAMIEAVCRAINHLAVDCTANKALFMQFHTIRLLYATMQAHHKEVDTLYLIWKSISILTERVSINDSDPANLLALEELDELRKIPQISKAIVDAIRLHSAYEEIPSMGLVLLLRLGIYCPQKVEELMSAGLVKHNANGDFEFIIQSSFEDVAVAFEFERLAAVVELTC